MSIVRFAMICDRCDKRSDEYQCWPSCRICGEDVCGECSTNPSGDESNKADCLRCLEQDRQEKIGQPVAQLLNEAEEILQTGVGSPLPTPALSPEGAGMEEAPEEIEEDDLCQRCQRCVATTSRDAEETGVRVSLCLMCARDIDSARPGNAKAARREGYERC